tara:strand:- start:4954 stop:6666 length:1713 start_codon:yes stop_codon:yes gene_type:complete
MIKFLKIRWKNFLSYGNTFTEIDLTKNKSTLIIGQNGAGKSTMLDALSYALFAKPHRNIIKNQLPNSINQKNCVVEAEFSVGRSLYKIVRSIKPTKFEIWKDGEMLNQSYHSKDYQKILEQNILKLNHKSFHQVIVLGSSSFIPFMQLPARHRRNVIEDLLDINVFSKMNVILREKTSILKDEIKELSYNLEIANNRVATQKKYIQDVKQLTDQNIESKNKEIDEARASIDDLVLKNSDMTKELEELAPQNKLDLKETSDKKTDILHKQARLRTNIETLVKNAKFYEDNSTCPTCEQTITEEFRANKIKLTKEEAKALSDDMIVLRSAAAEVEYKLTAANNVASKLTAIQNDITSNNKEIERLTRLVKKTLDEISSDSVKDLNEAKAELEKIIETVTEANDQKTKANEQYSYNLAMSEMLKDTGIKTKIIKQYLPVMNTLVNQYLQVLDFYVHFDLDEEFNETIRSRHRDVFTYDSFSEGEKQRIDLSLLFTWRQIAKMKNSVSTNLLILDETFDSSLDHDGVENLLKILNTLGDGTNIFVISHKGEILNGKFDDTIEFKKERNFSKIAA